ncbi:class I SAM-dependent methyltransferase [bacterium]|nr:class I SAM-dependent methyltransferase [bacterium]
MKACLICGSPIEAFQSFGSMPLANGFLTAEDFDREYFFDLRVGFCSKCSMVQLLEQPPREKMFHDQYPFFSSTSRLQAIHFERFAEDAGRYLPPDDPFVVEIGSNDGILLRHFAKAGRRHLGVEPSAGVAAAARERGVRTMPAFFEKDTARRIVEENGRADAVLAANVLCHIPYFHSVAEGIDLLLSHRGVFLFEDPYLGDIIEKTSYDQIYDEHVFFFSLHSVQHAFGLHGMEVIDLWPQKTHGGSMRYGIARRGVHPVSDAVRAWFNKEKELGLDNPETYARFRERCEESRRRLKELLTAIRREGRRVVGYAATSKSTTVTNYCGLTPDLIEGISDTTPVKQGKYSPGAHIPVFPYEKFSSPYPDYALLFGWNHKDEIMAKEESFAKAGGKWIVYVPRVEVLA